jgi:hypothetical protein
VYLDDLREGWTFNIVRIVFVAARVFLAFVGPAQPLLAVLAHSHGESGSVPRLFFPRHGGGRHHNQPVDKEFPEPQ